MNIHFCLWQCIKKGNCWIPRTTLFWRYTEKADKCQMDFSV